MNIKMTSSDTECELLLDGRLDTNTSSEAEAIFIDISERFDRVVLNMAKLSYVSSAGLRIIKNFHITMSRKHGELVLKNVNKMVMGVFEMTGFAGLLRFE